MADSNPFTYRYAIRRPDGELIPKPKSSDLGLRGLFGPVLDIDDDVPRPRTWDSREDAERALADIKRKAAEIGIGEWLGVIVQQLCTPFTMHDPAEHFADEVQQWLDGGAE